MDWSNLTDEQVYQLTILVKNSYQEGWVDRDNIASNVDEDDWEDSWEESLTKQDLCVLRERFQEKDS